MAETGLTIPSDVIVLPGSGGRWLVVNARARTAIALDGAGLDLWREAERADASALVTATSGRAYPVWRIGRFAQRYGLLADPTPYDHDPSTWPAPQHLDAGSLISCCVSELLLVSDLRGYFDRFAPKTSIVDRHHFGNLHEQLGYELLLVERADPSQWWLDQKFGPDGTVRPNLYHSVQELFLERFWRDRLSPGMRVLDIGCGVGVYADRVAGRGASVLGVDPDPRYIELARARSRHGARFERMRVGEPGGLDPIATGSMDLIFMSDALLFYFHPPARATRPDIDELLRSVRRILRPKGSFVSMEPHPVFWLAPWLGDVSHPFTVVTEYAHREFGVTPTIAESVHALTSRGFAVTGLTEVTAGELLTGDRATHFASEFPLWLVIEARLA